MAEKEVKVGLVGFGTVGSGVAKILLEDADKIAAKTGIRLRLACVVDTDTESARPVKLPDGVLTDDLSKLLTDETIGIGIELIGGTTIAKSQRFSGDRQAVREQAVIYALEGVLAIYC